MRASRSSSVGRSSLTSGIVAALATVGKRKGRSRAKSMAITCLTAKRRARIFGHARRLCSDGFRIRTERTRMATLAFNAEEIAPRELKPSLYELDGISRQSVEAHYKLYQGYVGKRNELLGKLAEVDLSAANQVYSEVRALKVDLSFAVGGVKNHEIYFEHLGGDGGAPTGAIAG